jgi:hypothetical protein
MLTIGTKVKILGTTTPWLKGTIGTVGVVSKISRKDEKGQWYLVELPYIIMGDNKWYYVEPKLEEYK